MKAFLVKYGTEKMNVMSKHDRLQVENYAREEDANINRISRILFEGTATAIGLDFFCAFARLFFFTTGIKHTIITECINSKRSRVRTLVYSNQDEIVKNFEYDLVGTPCEKVINVGAYYCSDDLDSIFPLNAGVKAYFGVPIVLSNGELHGHIAVFDNKPFSINERQLNSILCVLASRVQSEIERNLADEKLKAANAELQTLLENSKRQFFDLFEEAPIAYVHEHPDTKLIRANQAALRILGIKPEEVTETYGASLVPNTSRAQHLLKKALESMTSNGTDANGVILELRRKDNDKPIWLHWWSNPSPDKTYSRTMFIDITDKVMLEETLQKKDLELNAQTGIIQVKDKLINTLNEELRATNEYLEETNRHLSLVLQEKSTKLVKAYRHLVSTHRQIKTLIYHTSHGLRGPVTSIEGLLNLIKLSSSDNIKPYLDMLELTNNRMKSILHKLSLTYSILDSSGENTEVELQSFHFNTLICDSLKSLQKEMEQRKIIADIDIKPNVKLLCIVADIKLILHELLENAVYHSIYNENLPGLLELKINKSQDGNLLISVSNCSDGLVEKNRSRIYDMFFRASANAGVGLGLFNVKSLVLKMNGSITFSNSPNGVITFTLSLPIKPS